MSNKYCATCGNENAPGSMVCATCGSPVNTTQSIPSTPVTPTPQYAPKYGQATAVMKTKTPAVLLAVFLGTWTWLYTYQRDATKFWITLGAQFLLFLLGIGFIINWGFWLWAVIEASNRSDDWYDKYPNVR